ncbi:MAG: monooxygenase [Acidimicrobiia bacterium]|nr:monooxygenase [Acidimicrobiia bacterium]
MPGRTCAPAEAGDRYENVHVGVQRAREVVDLVPGDADRARWSFEVRTKRLDDGLDFAGPFVQGRRGDRFIYLSWGSVREGSFHMFRRAKLHLADVDSAVLESAVRAGALRCRVRMTDSCGNPRCARVRPPDAIWT